MFRLCMRLDHLNILTMAIFDFSGIHNTVDTLFVLKQMKYNTLVKTRNIGVKYIVWNNPKCILWKYYYYSLFDLINSLYQSDIFGRQTNVIRIQQTFPIVAFKYRWVSTIYWPNQSSNSCILFQRFYCIP